ncbi:unnamed protein product [Camellia sinensis]|uniref:uncharacterized protein LOC114273758 n=1 Tax=Camellia sinensis TaxID=4442 RepID=UPI0010364F5C|nr:uncharacterized protein LOC114273758 [Camellia sinensis]
MAAKKFTTILILTTVALVVMGSAITGKALSDCAKNCMPTCLAEEDTTMSDCENSCESFCETQGSNSPVNIFGTGKRTPKFDAKLYKEQVHAKLNAAGAKKV